MKAFGLATLAALGLFSGSAEAHNQRRREQLAKLGYDDAYYAKKFENQKKLAHKAALLDQSHDTRKRRMLRQAQDSEDLAQGLITFFIGLVDGASFETRSTCNQAIVSMADNVLSAYNAVQGGKYWEITIYQTSIQDNGAVLTTFCSFEQYQNVINQLIDFDSVDTAGLTQGWQFKEFNTFWGSDAIEQWTAEVARVIGFVIEDRNKLGKCSKSSKGKSGEAKRKVQKEAGECWGKVTTILFDAHL